MNMHSLVACSAVCGLFQAAAQSPPQSEPAVVSSPSPATFSSRVNLVSVPVVVRNRDGQAIGNLKQEDFQLLDKGKSQVITKFTIETHAEAVGNASTVSPGTVSGAAPDPEKPVLPSRFVAYFFDDIHMKIEDFIHAKDAANRQLDRTLNSTTRAAVFTTSGLSTQDFTNDAAKLHAAINGISKGAHGSDKNQECPPISSYEADFIINKATTLTQIVPWSPIMMIQGLAQETAQCLHMVLPPPPSPRPPPNAPLSPDLERIQSTVWTAAHRVLDQGGMQGITALSTIQDIIASMSTLPGTRTIVMVSPGFILTNDQLFRENDIFDKAIRANVVINTLDVRGLYTLPGFQASDEGHISGAAGAALMQADNDEASKSGDLLAEFADATGGAFFHNNNDLENGLDRLAGQPQFVYVLGFSPDNLKNDGSYHALKVKLKNANLEIEARHGYWAPNRKIDEAEQNREEIHEAIFSRDELAEIPIKLNTEFFKKNPANAELSVQTWVDGKALKFLKTSGRNVESLTVVFNVFNTNGRLVSGVQRRFEFRLEDPVLESVRNAGLNVKEDFELTPGDYIVRVVVRDSTGRTMAAHNQGVAIE